MDPDVLAPVMVPSFCSLPHGPPGRSRVRAAGPFPDFSALMQSKDSLVSFGLGSGLPLLSAYLGAGACSWPATRASRERAAVGEWSPGPRCTGFSLGETCASQVTGPSRCRACHGRTPRRVCIRPRPSSVGASWPSSQNSALGSRYVHRFRGRIPHGPCACAPTLRRIRCRLRRKARYRLGRAHPWPGGSRTRFPTHRISRRHRIHRSFLTSVAWSHCFDYASWGLYDSVGKGWQWTAEWYAADTYRRDAAQATMAVDLRGPASGEKRVLRGGSWWCGACTCEGNGLYYGGKSTPDSAFNSIGFRCAKNLPP